MKRFHPTELCLKGENLTSLYKNAVKSYDFTAFWYARHDLPLRGINFEPYRTVFIKTATPVGVAAFMVRPTRFERATYRVGVCHSIQLSYERILTFECMYSIAKFFRKVKGKIARRARRRARKFIPSASRKSFCAWAGHRRRPRIPAAGEAPSAPASAWSASRQRR